MRENINSKERGGFSLEWNYHEFFSERIENRCRYGWIRKIWNVSRDFSHYSSKIEKVCGIFFWVGWWVKNLPWIKKITLYFDKYGEFFELSWNFGHSWSILTFLYAFEKCLVPIFWKSSWYLRRFQCISTILGTFQKFLINVNRKKWFIIHLIFERVY